MPAITPPIIAVFWLPEEDDEDVDVEAEVGDRVGVVV